MRINDRWHTKTGKRTSRYGKGSRWQAVYTDNNKEIVKAFTTKDAAQAFLSQISHEQRTDTYIDPNRQANMAEYWPLFQQLKSSKSRAYKTQCEQAWRLYVKPAFGDFPIKLLKPLVFQSWLESLKTVKNGMHASFSTKKSILFIAKSLCDLAVQDNTIASNPLNEVSVAKKHEHNKRYLTVDEADRLLAAALEKGIWLEVNLMLTLGLRRGEMAGLQVEDLDISRNRLTIARSIDVDASVRPPKNGKIRQVPLTPGLSESLINRSKSLSKNDYFFKTPKGQLYTPDVWRYPWKSITKAAQLENFTTHELRHTAASWAIQAGADIKTLQRMLGHASAAMTLDVYGHLFDDGMDDVMNRIQMLRAKPDQNQTKIHEIPLFSR